MWKLYIKLLGKDDLHLVMDDSVGATGDRWRPASSKEHKGFALMSNAVTYITSAQFVEHVNKTYGKDSEITEVIVKFEDIV